MREDLWRRYGEERIPRYTSYPTAPHFSEAVTDATAADWLAALPPGLTGSIYLHVPFCRAMCWYCGCHTTVARRDEPVLDYARLLRREIEILADRLAAPLPIAHLHLGGGTPTILPPHLLRGLLDDLRTRFPFAPDAELAVEIDPRGLTPEMAAALADGGINRASLGVQSYDLRVQIAVNRVQTREATEAAADRLRAAGIARLNVDLLYGLPHQTTASAVDTAVACLAIRPERFSVFGYAHVPLFKKHQRKVPDAALPDGAARRAQAEAIDGVLRAAGYVKIGLDHYALPDDPIARAARSGALRRNFQGYTTDPADVLLPLGASAIGRLPQGYVQNETVIGRWAERVVAGRLATAKGYALTAEDRLRARLIERIMCDFAVDVAAVCAAEAADPDMLRVSEPNLAALEADGLIRRDGARIEIPDDMRLLVRSVAAAFDGHRAACGRLHSRAV